MVNFVKSFVFADLLNCQFPWNLSHHLSQLDRLLAASRLSGRVFLKVRSIFASLSPQAQINSNWPRACFASPWQRTRQLLSPLNEFRTRLCGRSMQGAVLVMFFIRRSHWLLKAEILSGILFTSKKNKMASLFASRYLRLPLCTK